MSQNKVISIGLASIIILLIAVVVQTFKVNNLRGELDIRKIDLKKKDKYLEITIDSLRMATTKLADHDSIWSAVVKNQRDTLVIERAKTKQLRIRYEKVKNAPVPHWNDSQLDSLLESILRHN